MTKLDIKNDIKTIIGLRKGLKTMLHYKLIIARNSCFSSDLEI